MAAFQGVRVVGQALNDFGFVAFDTIEGLGLNTFGFLWPCEGIWTVSYDAASTTWTPCADNNQTVENCIEIS